MKGYKKQLMTVIAMLVLVFNGQEITPLLEKRKKIGKRAENVFLKCLFAKGHNYCLSLSLHKHISGNFIVVAKMEHKAEKTSCNINQAFGQETVN